VSFHLLEGDPRLHLLKYFLVITLVYITLVLAITCSFLDSRPRNQHILNTLLLQPHVLSTLVELFLESFSLYKHGTRLVCLQFKGATKKFYVIFVLLVLLAYPARPARLSCSICSIVLLVLLASRARPARLPCSSCSLAVLVLLACPARPARLSGFSRSLVGLVLIAFPTSPAL
jgi:hypothetical protein